MLKLITNLKHCKLLNRSLSSTISQNEIKTEQSSDKFETVFKFPFIRYISMLNRLKVYQIVGTSLALPGCGLMEALNVLPEGALLSAAYIGKIYIFLNKELLIFIYRTIICYVCM